MNFLFFAGGSAVHGMEIAFHALMTDLQARGHRASAVVNGWNDGEYPRLLRESGLDYHEVDLGRLYLRRPHWTYHTLRSLPHAVRETRKIARFVRPDWLVFSDPQLLLWSALVMPPAQRLLYLHSKPERSALGLLARAARRYTDRIVCVSKFIAGCLANTPFREVRTDVVYNGIAMPTAMQPLSIDKPVRLGIVGAIAHQKQHLVLLRAVAQLKRRLPAGAFQLHIVGREAGRFQQTVDAEIATLGIGDVVVRPGFVKQRDALYRGLDVVVAPALDEGFGLTVVEAGAYGRPVVAARSGALPEIVQDERTGLLFDAGDVGALARALERLILDGALRQRLGEEARSWVGDGFTTKRMTDGFLDVLRNASAGE
jgi:glycosyltransferase involved in cell wall biosynthesis